MNLLRAVCCFVIVSASAAFAGVNTWTPIGPFGSPVTTFAVSRQNGEVVYAATESGLYRSNDAGRTWAARYVELPARINAVAIDPRDAEIVYIGTIDGLRRSTDGGVSWDRVRSETVDAVFVDGAGIVWAAFTDSGLLKSADRGATWQPGGSSLVMRDFAGAGSTLFSVANEQVYRLGGGATGWQRVFSTSGAGITEVALSPAAPQTVYAGGNAVYRSTDGGTNWKKVLDRPSTSDFLTDVIVDPDRAGVVVVVFTHDVFISENSGDTWRSLGTDPNELWAAAFVGNGEKTLLAGALGGVLRRVDEQWVPSSQGISGADIKALHLGPISYAAAENTGLFSSADGGATWRPIAEGQIPFSFAVDFTNSSTLYVGTGGNGILKSTDAGATFTRVGPFSTINSVAAHGSTVYATAAEFVLVSRDAGATWSTAYHSEFFANIRRVAIDPSVPSIAYTTSNPVAMTLDEGRTWATTSAKGDFRTLLIVPGSPSTVYVAAQILGRADSGSTTFTKVGAGLENAASIDDLAWNPATGTLYAAVTPRDSVLSQLYISNDRGATWQFYPIQPGLRQIKKIAASGNKLWVGTARGVFELIEGVVDHRKRRSVRK
ncbi:MAG TPA: hypothetical protein VF911_19805 [Thermoanaerobaculia bacterium]